MNFEWNESKQQKNVLKPGIDFADAREVFDDPAAYTLLSPRVAGELRYVTVGLMRKQLIAVVFTHRGDAVRIISARVARRNERKLYDSESANKKP